MAIDRAAEPALAGTPLVDPTGILTAPDARPRYAGHLHLDPSVSPVVRTDFDVDAYTRRGTARLPVDTALLTAEGPLPEELRLALGVLQRLEQSALTEYRALIATITYAEARITAFLATWLVERYWQSRALRDVLTADDETARPAPRRPLTLRGRLRRLHVARLQPLLSPLWTALAGESVAAGHMTRLAIQEASLHAALGALAGRLGGEARRVVETVAERHEDAVAFFTAEASARILRSRTEAATARLLLCLDSPLHGGGLEDPDLPAALAVIGADPRDRAGLHRARYELTRLLPGPDLPDAPLSALSRTGA